LKEPRKRNHRLDPSEVGRLERSRDTESPADALSDNRIDRRGRSDPIGPKRPSLAQQRELKAVADEAVDLSIDYDRVLAHAPQEAARAFHHLRARATHPAHLDEGK
jgi:hypothetical protein